MVGQEKMVDALIIGLLCDGHILLEGVLGPEKAINLNFKRVQFTTDLLPSHIIGMEIIIQNKINFI
ncbi:ATPase family associated with various cellular activities (AAA) [Campylobacter sputorum subsp. bubulus]|uniref:ATPase family associated with various cellular activities (AAA) n=1 Tax=Campylobacter sputorum subsp. sputorum TaxID=32024 RepID=A0A381DJB8_9BACT|nr:AAA family ATPase [Campylobacter sputorum]SUX09101.1 ATPase family associated with various cellular activities (AAA) [Campylobacter sputorum subsp. bubulus]SUX10792.1 ATPase family associated with various cellular activities (AAA) [Campylobacter sputorum subsp. sputorum]